MSQRRWEQEGKDICTGWDAQLQRFFLVVYDAQDELIYSNLDDDNPNLTIDMVFIKLGLLKIIPPASLRQYLLLDQDENDSNSEHRYDSIVTTFTTKGE